MMRLETACTSLANRRRGRLIECCLMRVWPVLLLMLCRPGWGEDFPAARERLRELGRLTAASAVHSADGFTDSEGLRALYYDGLPYRGTATRVFAWYGAPAGRRGKVPGVVLVHGGGGTAFRDWVR